LFPGSDGFCTRPRWSPRRTARPFGLPQIAIWQRLYIDGLYVPPGTDEDVQDRIADHA
jgi:hypothetical protein